MNEGGLGAVPLTERTRQDLRGTLPAPVFVALCKEFRSDLCMKFGYLQQMRMFSYQKASTRMSTNLNFENTDTILVEDRLFVPSGDVLEKANIIAYMSSKGFNDYESFYNWSLANRFEFWDDMAKELHWFEPWQTTFEWTNKPFFQWFKGGKFNAAYNCLDRHMQTPVRSKIAYYWEGDDGATRTVTYEELYVLTNRVAKVLQNLGIKKGDRVAIYMSMTPEMVASISLPSMPNPELLKS